MSKNSILENLLLKGDELNEGVEKLMQENEESVLKNTLNDAVRNLIKESLDEEEEETDSEEDFEETDVDAETGEDIDAAGDEEEMDIDASDEELPVGNDADMDMPIDSDEDMGIEMPDMNDMGAGMGGEQEVMDLTNASEEEVMQALKSLPDDATVEIVKKPSFDVNVNAEADMEMPMDDMDEMSMDDMDEMPMDDMDEDSINEMIEEALEEMEEGDMVNEMDEGENYPYGKGVKEVAAIDEELNEAYRRAVKENRRLKANEKRAVKMLKETMAKLEKLATVNSKLAYTTRLFTEHSTTRKEKQNIIAKMDKANTVGECEILFGLLSENLSKRVNRKNPQISKSQLTEAKETKTKKVIKEQATYIDPENARTMDLMFYKAKS